MAVKGTRVRGCSCCLDAAQSLLKYNWVSAVAEKYQEGNFEN